MISLKKLSIYIFCLALILSADAIVITVDYSSVLRKDIKADFYTVTGYSCPANSAVDISECGWSGAFPTARGKTESCYMLNVGMQMQGDNLVVDHYRCSTIGEEWRSSDIDSTSYKTRIQPPAQACCSDYDCSNW